MTSLMRLAETPIKGFRGGMVHTMYTALVVVNDFKSDTVILQIGSNDISDIETSVDSVTLAISLSDACMTHLLKYMFTQ